MKLNIHPLTLSPTQYRHQLKYSSIMKTITYNLIIINQFNPIEVTNTRINKRVGERSNNLIKKYIFKINVLNFFLSFLFVFCVLIRLSIVFSKRREPLCLDHRNISAILCHDKLSHITGRRRSRCEQLNAIRIVDIRKTTDSSSKSASESRLTDFVGGQRRKYPAGGSCVKVNAWLPEVRMDRLGRIA